MHPNCFGRSNFREEQAQKRSADHHFKNRISRRSSRATTIFCLILIAESNVWVNVTEANDRPAF
jgi:hypothetical protein